MSPTTQRGMARQLFLPILKLVSSPRQNLQDFLPDFLEISQTSFYVLEDKLIIYGGVSVNQDIPEPSHLPQEPRHR